MTTLQGLSSVVAKLLGGDNCQALGGGRWRTWSLCSRHGDSEGSGVPALFKSNVFSGDLG